MTRRVYLCGATALLLSCQPTAPNAPANGDTDAGAAGDTASDGIPTDADSSPSVQDSSAAGSSNDAVADSTPIVDSQAAKEIADAAVTDTSVPASCPKYAAISGQPCAVLALCTWGQECCCGLCSHAYSCACDNGKWSCKYSEFCLGPASYCGDTEVISDQSAEVVAVPKDSTSNDAKDPDPPECPGSAYCPCTTHADCDTAICIDSKQPGQKLCAQPCVDQCPKGYKCSLFGDPEFDLVAICKPE